MYRRARRFRPQLQPNETYVNHIVSRVVDKRFIFEEAEKREFVSQMRRYEAFCRVRVIGYCLMSNHFHLLVEASGRPAERPGELALLEHVQATLGEKIAASYRDRLDPWRETAAEHHLRRGNGVEVERSVGAGMASFSSAGASEVVGAGASYAEQQYEKVLQDIWQRMYDVSSFVLSLKQQFTLWYNKRMERQGTLWEERFKSTLIEGGSAVTEVSAYIDLNPVRAGIVSDPKDYPWSQYGAAVAGDLVAQAGVIHVTQCYVALTQDELENDHWSAGQGRYRILMYRRGLLRQHVGGRTEGVFTAEQVEGVWEADGKLPKWDSASGPVSDTAAAEPIGISYVRKRIRYFTDGAVIGAKAFVERIFTENRDNFGPRRLDGARKMRTWPDGDGVTNVESSWGKLRVLRDLQKG